MRAKSRRSRCAALALSATALLAAAPVLAQRGATPVALFDGSELVACGVRFSGEAEGMAFEAELVLQKRATATSFRVVARWSGDEMPKPGIVDVRLDTVTQSTVDRLAPVAAPPSWDYAAEGEIAGLDGALLVRELMVSGVRISLRTSPREQRVSEVPGPLPQLVRAAYLNCAGDLFRPVD